MGKRTMGVVLVLEYPFAGHDVRRGGRGMRLQVSLLMSILYIVLINDRNTPIGVSEGIVIVG